ncbi:MAG: helicase-associated domain-containing protein, partial [Chloroflexi bacterium]|nr:helicase-associated domain-containing protein [Chloroflexota bacterium]
DCGADAPGGCDVVRLTQLGAHLVADAPAPPDMPNLPLIVQSTFEIICPPGASLYARFQLGRVAELQQSGTVTIFRLTRRAVLAAAERGIAAQDVLRFLEEQSHGALPPSIAYTLLEWGGQTEQVRLEHAVLLQTVDPIVMAQLRQQKTLGLGAIEPMTPTLLRVPDGDADDLAEQLRRAGWGVRDERIDPQLPLDDRDLKAVVGAALAYTRMCAELDLPCEISPALLQRLCRLVPARVVEAADQSAAQAVSQIRERIASQREED